MAFSNFPSIPTILQHFNIDVPKLGKLSPCPSPTHEDKKGSFSITKDGNTCYCQGCEINNGFGLLRALTGSKENAINWLKNNSFYDIAREKYIQKSIPLDKTFEESVQVAHDNLYKPMFSNQLEYLYSRGLTTETIKKFHIGYANHEFPHNNFTHRFLIPVISAESKILSLIGRAGNDNQEPKYIKLSKEEGSGLPLGYQHFDKAFINKRPIWLVEGEFDAISLEQNGHCAIAIGSVNPNQIFWQLLRKDTHLVVCFDNDDAGQTMIKGFIGKLLQYTLSISIAVLPDDCKDYSQVLEENQENQVRVETLENWGIVQDDLTKSLFCQQIYMHQSRQAARIFAKTWQIDKNTIIPPEKIYESDFLSKHKIFHTELYGNKAKDGFFKENIIGYYEQLTNSYFQQLIFNKYPDLTNSQVKQLSDRMSKTTDINLNIIDNLPRFHIPVQNGIVDIFENQLLAFNSSLKITKTIQTCFNSDAKCPVFDKFLWQIASEDDERVEAIKFVMGQILLRNEIPLQRFHIFLGERDNGKSIFINILNDVLGDDLTTPFRFEQFGSSFGFDTFVGKYFAECTDASNKDIESSELLKQLTGAQDRLRVEQKYKNAISVIPSLTIVFSNNQMPKFRRLESGIIKRINVIKFMNTFAEKGTHSYYVAVQKGTNIEKPDFDLGEKLKSEKPGILNIMIEYARKIIILKGKTPKSLDTASTLPLIQAESSSAIQWWFESGYSQFKTNICRGKEIYNAYIEWAKETGAPESSMKWLINKLIENNFIYNRTKERGYTLYQAIIIENNDEIPEEEVIVEDSMDWGN